MKTQTMPQSKIPYGIAFATVAAVIPWIFLIANHSAGKGKALVAIPADGAGLYAPISRTFSQAPFFVIADLQSSTARTIKNPYWNKKKEVVGLKAAYLLLDEKVSAVLANRLQLAVHNALYSRGVRVYDGNGATVLDAVQSLRSGTLTDLGPPKLPRKPDPNATPVVIQPCPVCTPLALAGGVSLSPTDLPSILIPEVGIQIASGSPGQVFVVSVAPGSLAQRAGLLGGDVILALGQWVVRDVEQFQRLMAVVAPAMGTMLTVDRSGTLGQLSIMPF